MTTSSIRKTAFALVAGSAVAVFALAAAAERTEQTFVKTNFRTITKSSTMLGDVPNHEIKQEVTLGDVTFSDARFGTAQEMVYIMADEIDGTGPHRGYFMGTSADGATYFGSFEGMTKTVVKPDGSWEATWEGAHRYHGGTGKYQGARGGGTYKGTVSPSQAAREVGKEVIER